MAHLQQRGQWTVHGTAAQSEKLELQAGPAHFITLENRFCALLLFDCRDVKLGEVSLAAPAQPFSCQGCFKVLSWIPQKGFRRE